MRLLVGLFLLVAAVVFTGMVMLANNQLVDIHLVVLTLREVPLWQGLTVAFVLGAVLAGAACSISILRLRLLSRRQKKEVARLEQEVHGLRTLPIENSATAARSASQKV